MSHLLPYLFFLACPVGMGLMMWMMMRGGGHDQRAQSPQPQQPAAITPVQQGELAQLRAELDQLRAGDRSSDARR